MLWDSGNHCRGEVVVSVSMVTCYNKRMDRVTLGFPTAQIFSIISKQLLMTYQHFASS